MLEKEFDANFNINPTASEKAKILPSLKVKMSEFINEYFESIADKAPSLEINNRLSSSGGRFFPLENKIELSGRTVKGSLELNNFNHLDKILKHELAHWYLYKTKQPYNDGDEVFEKLLLAIGSCSSGATNKKLQFAPQIAPFGFFKVSTCQRCGYEAVSTRAIGRNMCHADCGGSFKLTGVRLIAEEV